MELQAKQLASLKQTNAALSQGNVELHKKLEALQEENVRTDKDKHELQAKIQEQYDTRFEDYLQQRAVAMATVKQKVRATRLKF